MAVRMDRLPPVQLKLTAKLVPTGTVALPSSSLFLGLYFRYQCIYNCPQMFAMRNIIVAFFLVVFDILTIIPMAAVLVRKSWHGVYVTPKKSQARLKMMITAVPSQPDSSSAKR